MMLRVPDAHDAVRLAVRVISEVGQGHGALAVRVGAHTGSAVARDGDWFGGSVNLAARLAAAAQPGEILLTEATRSAAGDALGAFEVRARGGETFKNVSEPVEVYAITLAGQPAVKGLPVDPVCRMAVGPSRSAERRVYRGVEYHFCSPECAQVFDRHPGRYQGRSSSGELRVSDRGRERVAKQLRRAYAHERLNDEELEARAQQAYSARTRGELRAVTRDLPRPRRPRGPISRLVYTLMRLFRRGRRRLRRSSRPRLDR